MCGKVGEEGQRQGRAGPQFRLGVVRVQVVVKWGGAERSLLSFTPYPLPAPHVQIPALCVGLDKPPSVSDPPHSTSSSSKWTQ